MKNKMLIRVMFLLIVLSCNGCQAKPKEDIVLSKKNCASWQMLDLSSNENTILSTLRFNNDTYRTKFHQTLKNKTHRIYIKSLDDTYLKKLKTFNEKSNSSIIDTNKAYKKFGVNFKEVTSTNEYFNLKVHDYIRNEILKINISKIDDLILDPHAQNILMLDIAFFPELHILLGDFRFTKSSDLKSKRKLTVSDLASSLMMIIYGENLWENTVFPAPIKWIPMQIDRSGAPRWDISFTGEKSNLYSNDFREYIAKGWYWDYINEKDANWRSPYFGFWQQDKRWAKYVVDELATRPGKVIQLTKQHSKKDISLKSVHSLEKKLQTALVNIKQAQKNCIPKTQLDF